VQSFRDFDRHPVSMFFAAMEMALQFDVDIRLAENLCQTFHGFQRRLRSCLCQRRRQRAFFSAGQANQTSGVLDKILARGAGLFFVLAPFGIAEEVIARVKSRLLWWRR